MRLENERQQVIRYCQELTKRNLVKGTGGNISIYNPQEQLFAISPSGMEYETLRPEDIVVMDLQGEVVEGERKPSSEYEMHRLLYENREDIQAVVHTHSTFATVLGTLREGLPAVNYLIAMAGPDVRCARYASYGTRELAENALKAMEDRKAVILANHGLTAGGSSIEEAFQIAEQIEQCAEVFVRTRAIGHPVTLPVEEMQKMEDSFKNSYGQR